MHKAIITLSLLFLLQHIIAQPPAKEAALSIPENLTRSTTGISTYIKDHYQTDSARVRAIFYWIANNINYDIDRFNRKDLVPQPVNDVLQTRLAVCAGYSDLFNELCRQCNIESTVVSGYTRQNGNIGTVSHAWVAASLDHKWWLFDPTWAAGYVKENKFTRGYSTTYYKLSPDLMIKDHMPFDPMYQFLDHTLTNKDFIDGKTAPASGKPLFNYTDSLQKHSLLSKEEKIKTELRRLQANGIENEVINQYYIHLNRNTESFSSKNVFEQAMGFYKRSIQLFNEYISFKNQQFSSLEGKDIKVKVDSIAYYVNASFNTLGSAVARDEPNRQAMANAYKELEKFSNRLNQEKEFVTTYLNTDATARKQLFYRK